MSRLKELRRERGYTQIKMQHLTGIDQSDYSKLKTASGIIPLNNADGLLLHSIQAWIIWPDSRMLRMPTRGSPLISPQDQHLTIVLHKSLSV